MADSDLIEDRRYLIWSGAYFVVVAVLGYLVVFLDFPVTRDAAVDSPIFMVIVLPACVLVIFTTISALGHVLENRNYRWLIPILILAYVGAYLYGFMITAKSKREEN